MAEYLMEYLVCRDCGNVIGIRDGGQIKISLKIRGGRLRQYVVSQIDTVRCDHCGRTGQPRAFTEYKDVLRLRYEANQWRQKAA